MLSLEGSSRERCRLGCCRAGHDEVMEDSWKLLGIGNGGFWLYLSVEA
jgi:hypothetical protein